MRVTLHAFSIVMFAAALWLSHGRGSGFTVYLPMKTNYIAGRTVAIWLAVLGCGALAAALWRR